VLILTPDDADYPHMLREDGQGAVLTVSAPLVPGKALVAIVGTRRPSAHARKYAGLLAADLASAGVTVISGGAIGIDEAAHRGAMSVGGSTWLFAPHGHGGKRHRDHDQRLYDDVADAKGCALIHPFPDGTEAKSPHMHQRNRMMALVADELVVVQASWVGSGALSAARAFRKRKDADADADKKAREPFVVTASPWVKRFDGSAELLATGALPLATSLQLFEAIGIEPVLPLRSMPPPERPPPPHYKRERKPRTRNPTPLFLPFREPDSTGWSELEKVVYSGISLGARHVDEVVARAGTPVGATLTALLTLRLKDVVVEGPDGFFRRKCGA
jgi:DNA processing protein